jgi:Mg2+-importing ATPase
MSVHQRYTRTLHSLNRTVIHGATLNTVKAESPTAPVPFREFTTGTPAAVLERLGATMKGLGTSEADRRAAERGANVLSASHAGPATILLRQFRSPFVYLLMGAATLSFVLGEMLDGGFIVFFVFLNAALGFYQEFHSERTLQLLQHYVEATARVRRDGTLQRVPSRTLVVGDIVEFEPGDIVPADVRFLETYDLQLNESALTGESAPVSKSGEGMAKPVTELYEASNLGFSGTTVVSGTATGVIFGTGGETAIGSIARLTVETERVSGYDVQLRRFSRFTLLLIGATLSLVIVGHLLIKGSGGSFPELLIFSIALAVSVTPEALPLVTTFALSRGALQLAKEKVVVKRLSAVEDLGSIEILCTDKTGTLTENRLTVDAVEAKDSAVALRLAALASNFSAKAESVNPFDVAIGAKLGKSLAGVLHRSERVHEIPFDPTRRRNTVVVRAAEGLELITRGAPEAVLPLCKNISGSDTKALQNWITEQGRQGRRVLAMASRLLPSASVNAEEEERDLTFAGLIAFSDPIKPTTLRAVQQAKELGVAIKILTGDGPEVAGAVAHTIGLATTPNDVITGAALMALPMHEQHAAVEHYPTFARVSPEQKFAILQLLREKRAVGFLGEGINDAPVLKVADVALVVQGASDIAREAADIVLLNRSLHVVIEGIQQGRRVFVNVTKYITATLSSNFGNFYALAIASLFIPYLPQLPLQILLLNLLTDFPMITIATDTVDPEEVNQPRRYDVKGILLVASVLGVISTLFDFMFFAVFVHSEPATLQTMWFVGSVLTELVFLYSVRTKRFLLRGTRASVPVIALSILAGLFALVLPYTAFGHQVFQFIRPTPQAFLTALGIVAAYLIATEGAKLIYYRFLREPRAAGRRAA